MELIEITSSELGKMAKILERHLNLLFATASLGFGLLSPSIFAQSLQQSFQSPPLTLGQLAGSLRKGPIQRRKVLSKTHAPKAKSTLLAEIYIQGPAPLGVRPKAQKPTMLSQATLTTTPALLNQPKIPASTKPEPAPNFERLFIGVSGVDAHVVPDRLSFTEPGKWVELEIAKAFPSDQVSFFLRDPGLVELDPKSLRLKAMKAGKTELFIIANQKMLIVPIEVSDLKKAEQISLKLELPKDLQAMPPGFAKTLQAQISAPPEASLSPDPDQAKLPELSPPPILASPIEPSELEQAPKDLAFKIMDSRSTADLKEIYPVPELELRVIGIDRPKMISDFTGSLRLDAVPQGSRFIVDVNDPKGRFVPTRVEVSSEESFPSKGYPIRMLSFQHFEGITGILGISQRSDLGSLCGTLLDQDSSYLSGKKLSINAAGNGPYFFNSGLPDAKLDHTTENGRFCFFNIEPGMVQLGVFDEGGIEAVFPTPVFAGNHLEENFHLAKAPRLRNRLAVLPSAHLQLYQDQGPMKWGAYDYVEINPLGWSQGFEALGFGLVGADAGSSMYKDRLLSHIDASEFEPAIYNLDLSSMVSGGLIPLFPRGFAEDIYHALSEVDGQDSFAFDPALGQLVVFHGQSLAERGKSTQIRLYDSQGFKVPGGWYFGAENQGVIRAIFFNLNPGIYTAQILDQDGRWRGAATTLVEGFNLSVLATGQGLKDSNPGR